MILDAFLRFCTNQVFPATAQAVDTIDFTRAYNNDGEEMAVAVSVSTSPTTPLVASLYILTVFSGATAGAATTEVGRRVVPATSFLIGSVHNIPIGALNKVTTNERFLCLAVTVPAGSPGAAITASLQPASMSNPAPTNHPSGFAVL